MMRYKTDKTALLDDRANGTRRLLAGTSRDNVT